MDINFKNQYTLITGADGNLGSETAKQFGSLNSNLILLGTDKKKLLKLSNIITSKNAISIEVYECDFLKKNIKIKTIGLIKKKYKKIDNIVHCAAYRGSVLKNNSISKFPKQDSKNWNDIMNVNVLSIYDLCKELYQLINRSKNPSIINISSIHGIYGPDWNIYKNSKMGNSAGYSISKAALNHLTKWLSKSFKQKVRINTISPGGIYNQQNKSFVRKYISKTQQKRMAATKDVVPMIIFLSSNKSLYITGQNFIIDGGYRE